MNEKGFTLVEVIIAMAITGVIVVVFIPLLTAQYVNIHKTGDQSKATYDAVEKSEENINKLKDAKDETEKEEAKKQIEKNGGEVDDTVNDDNLVKIDSLGIEEEVDTITTTGKVSDKDVETELKVAVPKKTN